MKQELLKKGDSDNDYKDAKFQANINSITNERINKIKNHDLISNNWGKKYFDSQVVKISCPLKQMSLIR